MCDLSNKKISFTLLEIRKNNVISTNPFVYWRRVSRTTLYALLYIIKWLDNAYRVVCETRCQ